MPFKANKLPGKRVRKVVQERIKCANCCGKYTANWSVVVRLLKPKSDTKRRDDKTILKNCLHYLTMPWHRSQQILQMYPIYSESFKDRRWLWLKYDNLPYFADCFKNIHPIHIDWIEPGEQSDRLVRFIPVKNACNLQRMTQRLALVVVCQLWQLTACEVERELAELVDSMISSGLVKIVFTDRIALPSWFQYSRVFSGFHL